MFKNISLQVLILAIFWLVFFSLQQETIYEHSLGLISENWQNVDGNRTLEKIPFQEVTNENIVQWDASHYYRIMRFGYSVDEAGGDYVFAFFPLFPQIWKISGLPPVGIHFMNYIFFSCALLILLSLLSPKENRTNNLLLSFTLPSIIIFLIPYTEATYMLMTSIGIYGFVKKKYWIFFLGAFLASLTRPSFTFLLLSFIGTEFFFLLSHKQWKTGLINTFRLSLPLILGTAGISLYQYSQGSGSLFKFIEVQKYWENILSVPHDLRDWSHESFAINVGVLCFIALPCLVLIFRLLWNQLTNKNRFLEYRNPKDYLLTLSMLYLIGNSLFIIMYRGGSLHCLFRFTLCSPFSYILLFIGFDYIKKSHPFLRMYLLGAMSLLCLLVIELPGYSTQWTFSYFGVFMFMGAYGFWILQDFKSYKTYKVGVYLLLFLNIVWTTFLFNAYISDAWIFA